MCGDEGSGKEKLRSEKQIVFSTFMQSTVCAVVFIRGITKGVQSKLRQKDKVPGRKVQFFLFQIQSAMGRAEKEQATVMKLKMQWVTG